MIAPIARPAPGSIHNSVVRWHYRDPGLLWLFVPAYLVHLGEEWAGGFPMWIETVVGRPLPTAAFVIIKALALVLAIAGIRAAVREERHGWIAVTIATIALTNALAHAAGAALTRSYAPGLISGVVLYVPVGSLAIIRAVDQAPRAQVIRGVLVGLAIHTVVGVVAWSWTQVSG